MEILAIALRPFVLVLFVLIIGYPVRRYLREILPESRFKRFLLHRLY
jgi:hypothetical protein